MGEGRRVEGAVGEMISAEIEDKTHALITFAVCAVSVCALVVVLAAAASRP